MPRAMRSWQAGQLFFSKGIPKFMNKPPTRCRDSVNKQLFNTFSCHLTRFSRFGPVTIPGQDVRWYLSILGAANVYCQDFRACGTSCFIEAGTMYWSRPWINTVSRGSSGR